jgi:hypothetical protein
MAWMGLLALRYLPSGLRKVPFGRHARLLLKPGLGRNSNCESHYWELLAVQPCYTRFMRS